MWSFLRPLVLLAGICGPLHAADFDLLADNRIDAGDLAVMAANWLRDGSIVGSQEADFDRNGIVDLRDVSLFGLQWRTVPQPRLIGWWKFDEGAGQVAHDSSGRGHDGVISNAVWSQGVLGRSLNFHGPGRYVTIHPGALQPLAGGKYVTVAFWLFGDPDLSAETTAFQAVSAGTSNNRVIAAQIPWYGTVYWDTINAGIWDRVSKEAGTTELKGRWNHWALSKDANTGEMRIFLNGLPWANASGKRQSLATTVAFKIGANAQGGENYGGCIDDFRVYDAALGANDVRAIYLSAFDFEQWGVALLRQIDQSFRQPGSNLYAESVNTTTGVRSGMAYVWPQGIQFRALANAAAVDPTAYLDRLKSFASELHQRYWIYRNGRWGYSSSVTGGTRFYDDNAWLALTYMELYELSGHDPVYLQRAEDTIAFVMSGENPTPQSGIAWEEGSRGTAVCSTAPAVLGNLLLYRATHNESYLDTAQRLYGWITNPALGIQDVQTGLFHQGCDTNLQVNWGHRAYQTAVPLQVCLLFSEILGDPSYLAEAQRLARSMEQHWVQEDGSLAETGQWGGADLIEAYVDLYKVDLNFHWLDLVCRMLHFLRTYSADVNGWYPEYWNARPADPIRESCLLYQAPVAAAYWKAASVNRN
jgi:hypothetical protein